jgi:transposase
MIALTVATQTDASAFKSVRRLAASLRLTPQEHSTGSKQRMSESSRAGNERLRSLLAEGAMSVINAVATRGGMPATPRLLAMLARRPKNVVAVSATRHQQSSSAPDRGNHTPPRVNLFVARIASEPNA